MITRYSIEDNLPRVTVEGHVLVIALSDDFRLKFDWRVSLASFLQALGKQVTKEVAAIVVVHPDGQSCAEKVERLSKAFMSIPVIALNIDLTYQKDTYPVNVIKPFVYLVPLWVRAHSYRYLDMDTITVRPHLHGGEIGQDTAMIAPEQVKGPLTYHLQSPHGMYRNAKTGPSDFISAELALRVYSSQPVNTGHVLLGSRAALASAYGFLQWTGRLRNWLISSDSDKQMVWYREQAVYNLALLSENLYVPGHTGIGWNIQMMHAKFDSSVRPFAQEDAEKTLGHAPLFLHFNGSARAEGPSQQYWRQWLAVSPELQGLVDLCDKIFSAEGA